MGKFRFYEDRQVMSWTREYFDVEAPTLQDAIEMIQKAGVSLNELENDVDGVVWSHNDHDVLIECCQDLGAFEIFSCDLENNGDEGEILFNGRLLKWDYDKNKPIYPENE